MTGFEGRPDPPEMLNLGVPLESFRLRTELPGQDFPSPHSGSPRWTAETGTLPKRVGANLARHSH